MNDIETGAALALVQVGPRHCRHQDPLPAMDELQVRQWTENVYHGDAAHGDDQSNWTCADAQNRASFDSCR